MQRFPSDRLLSYATLPQTLPPGFAIDRESEAFIDREIGSLPRFSKINAGGVVGMRFRLGPLVVDHFVGDVEPQIDLTEGPRRRISWQPTIRTDVPPGWSEPLTQNALKRSGYARLTGALDYDKTWTQHARRHKRAWEKQTDWEIREVALQPFLDAYWKSPKDPVLKGMFIHFLRKKVEGQGNHVHLAAVVRRNRPEEIGAGFAYVDVPELKQSNHTVSFICAAAKDSSAGNGLIDYWFKHGIATGLEYLNFGNYWAPGCPREWLGFSEFKAQFGVTFIDHPNQRVRWAGTWKNFFFGNRKNH